MKWNGTNKYDIYIFLLIATLCFGNIGGALQVTRVIGIALFPVLLNKWGGSRHYMQSLLTGVVIFMVFATFSLFWTPDRTEGVKELFYYTVHFAVFFEILVFTRLAKAPMRTMVSGWLVTVTLTLIVAVWEITTDNHLEWES